MSKTSLVIFGISGDLVQTKVLPAIERLHVGQVIGVSRRGVVGVEHVQGDINNQATFEEIKKRLKYKPIYYLAVSPDLYPIVIPRLDPEGAKLVLEKPFGRDEASARSLGRLVGQYFVEDQIYRIDHYLGKQSVRELEQLPKIGIKQIKIVATETKGIGGRAGYYDAYGAVRDVGQNHILQMLKLATGVPIAKVTVDLASVRLGQYQGYVAEQGASPDSQTETAFAWAGQVGDITMEVLAGKMLAENRVEVRLVYKSGEQTTHSIRSEPDTYKTLLTEAIEGDKRYFVSEADIEAQWRVVDPILKNPTTLLTYEPGASEL